MKNAIHPQEPKSTRLHPSQNFIDTFAGPRLTNFSRSSKSIVGLCHGQKEDVLPPPTPWWELGQKVVVEDSVCILERVGRVRES